MQTDSEYISIESAGKLLGVSPRTIRNWVASGKLPAISGKRGRLVKRTDVLFLGTLAGKIPEYLEAELDPRSVSEESAGNDAEDVSITAIESAREQLEAIRDEWLAPLIERIGDLEREAGRLEERARSQAEHIAEQKETISGITADRDQLRQRAEQAEQELATAEARIQRLREAIQQANQEPTRPWWRFWS